MPTKYIFIPPKLRLLHMGPKGLVVIFETYADDDVEQGVLTHVFTTSPLNDEDVIDVRELPNYTEVEHPPYLVGDNDTETNRAAWDKFNEDGIERKHIDAILKQAIESGHIKPVPLEDISVSRYGHYDRDDWDIFSEEGVERVVAVMNLTLDMVVTKALLARITEVIELKVLADEAYRDFVDVVNMIDGYGASDTEPRTFAWHRINEHLGVNL